MNTEITRKRWPNCIGGTYDDQPVPAEAWARGQFEGVRYGQIPAVYVGESVPPRELKYDTDRYRRRTIFVGRTRLVLDAMVFEHIGEGEALETVWIRLLAKAGI